MHLTIPEAMIIGTDDLAFGADDVAASLSLGGWPRKLRFLMTDNSQAEGEGSFRQTGRDAVVHLLRGAGHFLHQRLHRDTVMDSTRRASTSS